MDIALEGAEVSKAFVEKEDFKIQEYLKRIDRKFYFRAIENRRREAKIFPHCGESGTLFVNTFQYVNLFRKK